MVLHCFIIPHNYDFLAISPVTGAFMVNWLAIPSNTDDLLAVNPAKLRWSRTRVIRVPMVDLSIITSAQS